MNFLLIIAGLSLLIFGGNWLLKSAVSLSLRLQIPKIVIGMTVVSFGTSAPELIVSLKSAVDGFTDLALSNVIGSNIANLSFVLGITLIVAKIDIKKIFYMVDWPIMMIASAALFFVVNNDRLITRIEGVVLFSLLIIFLVYLLQFHRQVVADEMPEDNEVLPDYQTLLFFLVGTVSLWGGSEILIRGAANLILELDVSERFIGITLVSIGTSIPELAASIIGVLKKEKAISLGNLIGSNIFNILAVLGVTAIVAPVSVANDNLVTVDIYWMLGISFLILPLVFLPKKMQLNIKAGLTLLTIYIIFLCQIIT